MTQTQPLYIGEEITIKKFGNIYLHKDRQVHILQTSKTLILLMYIHHHN